MGFDRIHLPRRLGSALALVVTVTGVALPAHHALAEEGGSGHYLPGSMASFIDGVPLTETFLLRANVVYYNGSITANKSLPIAGLTAAGVDASSWGFGLTALWRPPLDLGERGSYAMSRSRGTAGPARPSAPSRGNPPVSARSSPT